jgi:hypothetical protein
MSDYPTPKPRPGRSPEAPSRLDATSTVPHSSRIGPSPNREVGSREAAGQGTDPWSPAVGDCREDSAVASGHPAWAAGAAGGRRSVRSVADRLTSLDHVLLALLQTHRVLTTPQLITLVGRPERTVDYRLSRLRDAGVVERTRPYAASGSAPFFWWLTRRGAQLVEGTSPAPGKATPNPLFLRHSTAIAGLYVALVDLGPHLGLAHCSWDRDETAWEEWSPSLGRAKHLRPDAHMEVTLDVDGEPGRAGAFVEIDFATMDQRRLAAKVARHRDYASERAWWNRHPGCPALLLLTTSDARVTRFLANLERARPRPSYYGGEEDSTAWEPVVAACACVSAPEEALSAPVWRTSAADAPSTLHSLLSADVRTYRHLVATLRAQRAADEQYRQLQAIHTLAADSDRLADAMDDAEAAAAVRFLFDQVLPYNPSVKKEWAAQHLGLVTTTHTWWVDGDGHSGWPPPPAQVVSGWRALYRGMWAEQATRLLDRSAESADDPRLRRPAADLAAGTLLRSWRLEREPGPDARSAAEEAALDYGARRDAAVADALRALPLHRRLATSRATLEADYDAQHLVVCVDCTVVRHDDPEQRRYGGSARCPLCDGELVPTQQAPALPAELGDSLALVAERLGRIESGRL